MGQMGPQVDVISRHAFVAKCLGICRVMKAGSSFSSADAIFRAIMAPCHLQIIAPQSCRGTSWPGRALRKTSFK